MCWYVALVDNCVPDLSVHLINSYPMAGVAVRVIFVPTSYVPPPVTVPEFSEVIAVLMVALVPTSITSNVLPAGAGVVTARLALRVSAYTTTFLRVQTYKLPA